MMNQIAFDLLEYTRVGYAVLDESFHLIYANRHLLKILRINLSIIIDRNWESWIEIQKHDRKNSIIRWVYKKLKLDGHIEFIGIIKGYPRVLIQIETILENNKKWKLVSFIEIGSIDHLGQKYLTKNMNRDILLAQRIQKNINNFIIEKIEGRNLIYYFKNIFIPSSLLSGDLIHMKTVNRRYFTVFLGDGRGHGIPAALYSTLIYSYLNILSKKITEGELNPGLLMKSINEIAYHDFRGTGEYYFFSGIFMLFDGNTNKVSICNAGHPPVYLIRSENLTTIKSHGPVVGMMSKVEYTYEEFTLKGKDILVCFTDGLYDIILNRDNSDSESVDDVIRDCVRDASDLTCVMNKFNNKIINAEMHGNVTDDISILSVMIEEK